MTKRLTPVVLATLWAASANTLLFLAARAAGAFGEAVIVRAEGAPLTWQPVVAASVLGVVAGAVARLALERALRPAKARRAFLLVSALVLLLSLASPVQGLEGAELGEILLLELMHVTTAAAAVAGAEWAARPDWRFGSAVYSPRRIEPATALVTGATSGIGAAVAQQLASLPCGRHRAQPREGADAAVREVDHPHRRPRLGARRHAPRNRSERAGG